MTWTGPAGLYRPGTTVLHRAPLGLKLGGLAVLGVALLALHGAWVSVAVLAAVCLLAAVGRLPWRATLRSLGPAILVATLLMAFEAWRRGWETGIEAGCDLVTLILAATIVTATTATDRMLDAVARVARPLRRFGLEPETFSMAVSLMLRSIPALEQLATDAKDAARARGLERSPRARLVPLVVRAIGRAHDVGDALAARGVGD